jgi:hypothetical protein
MSFRQQLCVLPVAAVAGLALTAGCSSTSTKRPTAGNTATTATSTAGGTTSAAALTAGGNVHLTDYTDNDGPTSTVILAGAVGDYGKAQSVNPDGSVTTGHDSQLNLMLTHGSFRLDMAELDKKFVAVLANLPVNTTTCSGTASVSGAVPIVAGSGTGSYKGIRGTFTLTVILDEVYRPTGCNETSTYLSQSIVVTGPGSVSLG